MAGAGARAECPAQLAENTNDLPSAALTERFIRGLAQYNITYSELFLSQWRYCGGDTSRHRKYYTLTHPEYEFPPHHDQCICGHPIKENCYITDGEQMIVLGNCCIKKFLTKENSGRTCSRCGRGHKNRANNLCKVCRIIERDEEKERLEEMRRKDMEERLRREEECRMQREKEKRQREKEAERVHKEMQEAYAKQKASLYCRCGIMNVCICENPTFELYPLNGKYTCTGCKNWKCRCG